MLLDRKKLFFNGGNLKFGNDSLLFIAHGEINSRFYYSSIKLILYELI